MTWRIKLALLLLVAIPAFTGYPLGSFTMPVVPGITWGWLIYYLTVTVVILILLGGRHFANTLSITALITLPVIFMGGTISYCWFLAGYGHPEGPAAYSPHYIALCLTMLTVIPLALSLVAVIPFHEIEHNLLSGRKGVSRLEKYLLMFLRVFNHILFFVIPNILEVMREEARFRNAAQSLGEIHSVAARLKLLIRNMIQIGVAGICAAVRYIPLWAVEISLLPDAAEIKKIQKRLEIPH